VQLLRLLFWPHLVTRFLGEFPCVTHSDMILSSTFLLLTATINTLFGRRNVTRSKLLSHHRNSTSAKRLWCKYFSNYPWLLGRPHLVAEEVCRCADFANKKRARGKQQPMFSRLSFCFTTKGHKQQVGELNYHIVWHRCWQECAFTGEWMYTICHMLSSSIGPCTFIGMYVWEQTLLYLCGCPPGYIVCHKSNNKSRGAEGLIIQQSSFLPSPLRFPSFLTALQTQQRANPCQPFFVSYRKTTSMTCDSLE